MALRVWMTSDGRSEVIVAAPSKAAAAKAMERSIHSFNQFASELELTHPIALVAMARPGIALWRPNARYYADPAAAWDEL